MNIIIPLCCPDADVCAYCVESILRGINVFLIQFK
ncbi:MAG: hypothetical protein MASP_00982 [Candidatus Methanolliviera sp. GoM_asphalt]|nr:MAG: hypothetical protein MASP_00982 [Candidatus Methanolliviera sp. GoM_asphalt]